MLRYYCELLSYHKYIQSQIQSSGVCGSYLRKPAFGQSRISRLSETSRYGTRYKESRTLYYIQLRIRKRNPLLIDKEQ